LLINKNGAGEAIATMNDSVSNSIEDSKSRMRIQPFNDLADRLFMVSNRCFLMVLRNANGFKSKGSGIADPVDDAACQLYVVGSRLRRCRRLNKLEFEG
jgi:hypothetical protein